MSANLDFSIRTLGEPRFKSPLQLSHTMDDLIANYVSDEQHILYNIEHYETSASLTPSERKPMEKAGPREMLYFDPSQVHAGIVTCGGLCPGLNDVVRGIVMSLWHRYGVRRISGLRYGYHGLLPGHTPPLSLAPQVVVNIHRHGGTILGSSRGGGNRVPEMVDTIIAMNINILFTIGGDGTLKGALAIAREAQRRGYPLSVVGVPKTIDNDLSFIEKSFGFDTAVASAVQAVSSAHVEAHDVKNGVGIVKVMGRESGFIAAQTTLASGEVNYVLIPELSFELNGPNGLLVHLKNRLQRRNHAVILVAEGAGQDLAGDVAGTDASGNRKLADIGLFLRNEIDSYFKKENVDITIKYIDPGYMIRSAPANSSDAIYCSRLGSNAVHAAMAGKTEVLISQVHGYFVHLPIEVAVSKRNKVDPESALWRDVIETTGQPPLFKN